MRMPMHYNAYAFSADKAGEVQADVPGYGWRPARPITYKSFLRRCVMAWRVFIGRYDALEWPGQYN